jgi:hypothetical protein
MHFNSALTSMLLGSYITRSSWTDGSYLCFLPGMSYIWKVAVVPNPAAGNWMPSVDDLVADDWEVMGKKEPTEVDDVGVILDESN